MLVLRFLASFSWVMHIVCCKQKKKKNFTTLVSEKPPISHFTAMNLVAKLLIRTEAEGDLDVIETSI